MAFDGDSNNWKNSNIRSWLNNQFYNGVFNEDERSIIQTTLVDNSLESTGYTENENVCENTEDKIYLLSYLEAQSMSSSEREMMTSDYARASGAFMYTTIFDGEYYGKGYWWLRSPSNLSSNYVRDVDGNGSMVNIKKVSDKDHGIVPVLKIKL